MSINESIDGLQLFPFVFAEPCAVPSLIDESELSPLLLMFVVAVLPKSN